MSGQCCVKDDVDVTEYSEFLDSPDILLCFFFGAMGPTNTNNYI